MEPQNPETVLVTGAAGFIGSHLTDRLLAQGATVVGLDNLSRGNLRNLETARAHPRFHFVEADLAQLDPVMDGVAEWNVDTVWHMVANSDIAAGVADPAIDLRNTFETTFNMLAVMRNRRMPKLIFASTSAIYGAHDSVLTEDTGPLFPISNYGAMKLACEGCISAAVESYLERAWIFRFPNVIGPRATHGVIFDLMKKLAADPPDLEVLGDGAQQKPYLHVSELLDAMLLAAARANDRLNYFNIGPPDEGATVREIADAVRNEAAPHKPIRYTGGSRGWVGDVPKFRYSIEKIKALGWSPRLTSAEAVKRAVSEIYAEMRAAHAFS